MRLEYILLSGVNDRPDHAGELARLCKTLRANVNRIGYNEVQGLPYQRPKSDGVVNFQNILRNAGVNAHVRKSRERDIDAACGQLRRKEQEKREALVTLASSNEDDQLRGNNGSQSRDDACSTASELLGH